MSTRVAPGEPGRTRARRKMVRPAPPTPKGRVAGATERDWEGAVGENVTKAQPGGAPCVKVVGREATLGAVKS